VFNKKIIILDKGYSQIARRDFNAKNFQLNMDPFYFDADHLYLMGGNLTYILSLKRRKLLRQRIINGQRVLKVLMRQSSGVISTLYY
jgi:hypothetical protein